MRVRYVRKCVCVCVCICASPNAGGCWEQQRQWSHGAHARERRKSVYLCLSLCDIVLMFVIYQLRIYTAQVSNSRVRVYVCVCVWALQVHPRNERDHRLGFRV